MLFILAMNLRKIVLLANIQYRRKVTYLVKSTFKTDLDFTPAQEAEKKHHSLNK